MSREDVLTTRQHTEAAPAEAPDTFLEGRAVALGGKFLRAALIALVLLFIFFLALHPLNSYDVWTHLATGRLMWEESRIPDHEPYSYTMNREMTVEEATPMQVVRYPVEFKDKRELPNAPPFKLVVPAGTVFDDDVKERLKQAGIPLKDVTLKIEKPLKRLTRPALDDYGRVVLPERTLLGMEEIETLREAGVKTVHVTVPWVNHEWLFQIGAYLSWKWFGLNGPIFYKIAILLVGYLFVLLAVYRRETHVLGLAALWLAGMVSYKRFFMRPEAFSIMFTAIWLFLIERFRHHQKSWSLVIWLPLLMVVWINAHGYFILGVFIPIFYLVGEGLQQIVPMPRFLTRQFLWKKDLIAGPGYRRLALAAALTWAATLVNPYFLDGARYPFDVLGEVADPTSVIRTVIGEMQPPFNFSFTYAVFYTWVLIYVSGASWFLNIRRLKFSRLILYAVSIVFLTKALRNMPFFGIPAAIFMGINVNEAWPETIAFFRRHVLHELRIVIQLVGQLAVAGFCIFFIVWMASDRFYVRDIANMRFGLGYSEDKFSMGAIEWVRDHKVEGNLFNAFGMGGLCMWKLYPEKRDGGMHYGGRRLFIDGRAEVYGGPFVKNYTRSLDVIPDDKLFRQLDEKYHFGVVFINWQAGDTHAMMRRFFLQENSPWALVFGDGVGYVFVRKTPENEGVIREARRKLENPEFVNFAAVYAKLHRALPGLPPLQGFREGQKQAWDVAMCLNADPAVASRTLAATGWDRIRFDRRYYDSEYDRLRRRWLSFLPKRECLPGEIVGQAGFAAATERIELADAILQGLGSMSPYVPDIYIQIANNWNQRGNFLVNQAASTSDPRKTVEEGMGALRLAVTGYEKALGLRRDYPNLTLQLATLSQTLCERTPAADRAERKLWAEKMLLYLHKSRSLIWPTVQSATGMASIYGTVKLWQDAIDMYESVLHLLPQKETAPLHNRLAACYVQIARQHPSRNARYLARAEEHIKLAIDLDIDQDPKLKNSWSILSDVYLMTSRPGPAESALLEIKDYSDAAFSAAYALGQFYRKTRRPLDAEKWLRTAISQNSRNLNAVFELAQVLAEQGRIAEAIALLEQILRIEPTHVPAQQMLDAIRRGGRPAPPAMPVLPIR